MLASGQGWWFIDLIKGTFEFSDKVAYWLGLPADKRSFPLIELEGRVFLDDLKELYSQLDQLVTQTRSTIQRVIKLRNFEGNFLTALVAGSVFDFNHNNSVRSVVGTVMLLPSEIQDTVNIGHKSNSFFGLNISDLLNVLPLGIGISDLEGQLLYVSLRARSILKLDPDVVNLGTITTWLAPENQNQALAKYAQLVKTRQPDKMELLLVDGHNERFYANIIGCPILDEQGNVKNILTIFENITETRQAKDNLSEFKNIVSNATWGIAKTQPGQRKYEFCNLAYAQMHGYNSTDELVGKSIEVVYPKNFRPNFRSLIDAAEPDEPVTFQTLHMRKNGDMFPVLVNVSAIKSISLPGQLTYVANVIDLSEIKNSELAITHYRERYRELVNHMTTGVYVYTPINNGEDFIVASVNKAACRLDKRTEKEFINKRLTEVFKSPKTFAYLKLLRRVNQTGEAEFVGPHYFVDQKVNGWRQNHIFRLPNGELVSMFEDITDKVLNEQKILGQNEELETQQKKIVIQNEILAQKNEALNLANQRLEGLYEQIRQEQDRLKNVINNTSIILWAIDGQANFTYTRGKGLEKIGLKPDDLIGKNLFEFFKSEPTVINQFETLFRNKQAFVNETQLIIASRYGKPEKIYFQNASYPKLDENGNIIAITGVSLDVTNLRNAEAELKNRNKLLEEQREEINQKNKKLESANQQLSQINQRLELILQQQQIEQDRLESIIKNTDIIVWSMDEKGNLNYLKGRALKRIGSEPETVLGTKFKEIYKNQKQSVKLLGQVPEENKEQSFTMHITGTEGNCGSDAVFQVSAHPVISKEGKFMGVNGLSIDTTQLVEAERELSKRNQELHELIETIPHGVIKTDGNLKIVLVNRAFKKMAGLNELEPKLFLTDVLQTLSGKDKSFSWLYKKRNDEGKFPSPFFAKLKQKNHNLLPVQIDWAELSQQNQNYTKNYVLIISDVTDKLNAENNLKELNRTKDKFFSIIAHDINNPFATLKGLAQLVTKEIKSSNQNPALLQYADMIYKTADRGSVLVSDLLHWSRAQTNRLSFEPHKINLSKIINECIDLHAQQAIAKNIAVINDIDKNVTLIADPNILKTIFRNLLSNAIKFTPKEGCIEFLAILSIDYVVVKVKDNGVGIEKDVQEQLFRIDKKNVNYGTERELGTGLGLILVKELVKRHGGHIEFESTRGQGTIFMVKLPISFTEKK